MSFRTEEWFARILPGELSVYQVRSIQVAQQFGSDGGYVMMIWKVVQAAVKKGKEALENALDELEAINPLNRDQTIMGLYEKLDVDFFGD